MLLKYSIGIVGVVLLSCWNFFNSNIQEPTLPKVMYQLDSEAKVLRERILKKKSLGVFTDSIQDMHIAIPTDPDEMTPEFHQMASYSLNLRKEIYRAKHPKQIYQKYIQSCITCHETHCPGPIRRIEQLKLK